MRYSIQAVPRAQVKFKNFVDAPICKRSSSYPTICSHFGSGRVFGLQTVVQLLHQQCVMELDVPSEHEVRAVWREALRRLPRVSFEPTVIVSTYVLSEIGFVFVHAQCMFKLECVCARKHVFVWIPVASVCVCVFVCVCVCENMFTNLCPHGCT